MTYWQHNVVKVITCTAASVWSQSIACTHFLDSMFNPSWVCTTNLGLECRTSEKKNTSKQRDPYETGTQHTGTQASKHQQSKAMFDRTRFMCVRTLFNMQDPYRCPRWLLMLVNKPASKLATGNLNWSQLYRYTAATTWLALLINS